MKLTLLGTKTCPNCKKAAEKLTEAGITFTMLYAEDPEGRELAIREKLTKAPSLIVEADDSKKILTNLSEIIDFISLQ